MMFHASMCKNVSFLFLLRRRRSFIIMTYSMFVHKEKRHPSIVCVLFSF